MFNFRREYQHETEIRGSDLGRRQIDLHPTTGSEARAILAFRIAEGAEGIAKAWIRNDQVWRHERHDSATIVFAGIVRHERMKDECETSKGIIG